VHLEQEAGQYWASPDTPVDRLLESVELGTGERECLVPSTPDTLPHHQGHLTLVFRTLAPTVTGHRHPPVHSGNRTLATAEAVLSVQ
jgi:hypothetical protein